MKKEINEIKIFIPTKNRLDNEKTYHLLEKLGLKPFLVIEPQEEEKAKKLGFRYILLPKNNQGITFARNFILDTCRKQNIEYACMMDDDISGFVRMENNKRVKDTDDCFLEALEYFINSKMCGTMQYHQFGVFANKYVSFYQNIEVIFFLYIPSLTNVYFEEDTIEDRDFSLDIVLNHGCKTFRLEQLCFCVPSIGTNKGGIESDSRAQKQIYWSNKMQKKWGKEIIKVVVKKNGLTDIRTNWRYVRKLVENKNTLSDAIKYTQSLLFNVDYSKEKEPEKEILPKQLQLDFMNNLDMLKVQS